MGDAPIHTDAHSSSWTRLPDNDSRLTGTLQLGPLISAYRAHGRPSAEAVEAGAIDPIDELLKRTFGRLEKLAKRRLRSGGQLGRYEATYDLLHTAWISRILKALSRDDLVIHDTEHFFALSAELIRQTLIDMDRRSKTARGYANATLAGEDHDGRSLVEGFAVGFDDLDLAEQIDVTSAMESLEPSHRRVLDLAVVSGLSRREIADVLGVTESEARTRLEHAKQALAIKLRSYESELED